MNNTSEPFLVVGEERYDAEPFQKQVMSVKKGEIYTVTRTVESGWWYATNQLSEQGWIPSNHVKLLKKPTSRKRKLQNYTETSQSNVLCPSGHVCSKHEYGRMNENNQYLQNRNLICDGGCENNIAKLGNDNFFACIQCDYDICFNCAKQKRNELCIHNQNWKFMQPSTLAQLLTSALGVDFYQELTLLMASFIVERKIKIEVLICDGITNKPFEMRKMIVTASNNCRSEFNTKNDRIRSIIPYRYEFKQAYLLDSNSNLHTNNVIVNLKKKAKPGHFHFDDEYVPLNYKRDLSSHVHSFPSANCFVGDVFKWNEAKLVLAVQKKPAPRYDGPTMVA